MADCSIRDDAKVVALVAEHLGYRADGVRQEPTFATDTLVAAANSAR